MQKDQISDRRGDAHDFPGVTFDFSKKKKLRIIMNGYVQEVIDEADVTLKRKQRDKANTSASVSLFKKNSESPV